MAVLMPGITGRQTTVESICLLVRSAGQVPPDSTQRPIARAQAQRGCACHGVGGGRQEKSNPHQGQLCRGGLRPTSGLVASQLEDTPARPVGAVRALEAVGHLALCQRRMRRARAGALSAESPSPTAFECDCSCLQHRRSLGAWHA